MIPAILRTILIINGIYDLACAASILIYPAPILCSLHSGMFAEDEHKNHPIIRRLIAYWIATYGTTRLISGLNGGDGAILAAAITYFVEALSFAHEHFRGKTLVRARAIFVLITSTAMGAAFCAITALA